MKNGTSYAAKVRKAYARLRQTSPPPPIPEADDPLTRLAIAILSEGGHEATCRQALDELLAAMVDWNDIRVSSPLEIHKALGNVVPNGLKRCQQLLRALAAIYDRENQISLNHLRSMGRRDARHFLENLNGVGEYAVASVILWSLGGHAIPVNDPLLAALRDQELVHPEASRGEVQAFLERNISAAEAKEFCLIMQTLESKKGRSPKRSSAKTGKKHSRRSRTAKEKKAASKARS